MCELVISIDTPHKLLDVKFKKNEFLGFTEELLQGRTLQVFHGPTSDSVSMASAIKACMYCPTATLQLNLYDLSGESHTVNATLEPFLATDGVPVACKILFESCPTLNQAEARPAATDNQCDAEENEGTKSHRYNHEPMRRIRICNGLAPPRRFYRTFWRGISRRLVQFNGQHQQHVNFNNTSRRPVLLADETA